MPNYEKVKSKSAMIQEVLLARVRQARRPALAPIIPLFRESARAAAAQ